MRCILFIIIVSGPLHCITLEDAPHIVAYGNGTPGIVQCTTCVTVYDIPDDQATVGMWKSCFSRWTLGLFLMKRRVPCAVCLVWNISCQQTGGFLIVSKGEAKGKNAHAKSKQQFWVSCKEWLRRRKPPINGVGWESPASDSLGSETALASYWRQLNEGKKVKTCACTKCISGEMVAELSGYRGGESQNRGEGWLRGAWRVLYYQVTTQCTV